MKEIYREVGLERLYKDYKEKANGEIKDLMAKVENIPKAVRKDEDPRMVVCIRDEIAVAVDPIRFSWCECSWTWAEGSKDILVRFRVGRGAKQF